jgi:membrane-bound serine protease (ClpP class)
MKAKVTNDAVSYIRGLAERRGRNAEWAERAVREAANLTATEAVAQHVVELVATDVDDLLTKVHGRTVDLEAGPVTLATEGATVRAIDPHLGEAFLQLIADPTIAYLLLSLGLLGLYLEFSNPGTILPGVAGAIFVVLGLFALGSLPVNWAGVLLMALAFTLFAIDIWSPSHFVLTAGGLVAFVLGSLLLMNPNAGPAFQIAPSVVAAVVLSLAGFTLFVATIIFRDRRRRPTTGREGLIGEIGIVRSRLSPTGVVFVEGERWQATSQSGPIEAGQPVRIVAVHGLGLVVTAAAEQTAARKEQTT